jgi:hypothetical protein
MQGKITRILNSGKAYNHPFQNILKSRSLFINATLKYAEIRTVFPIVLNASQILSLTLREENRLRVFEIRVLRKLCGPTGKKVTGESR